MARTAASVIVFASSRTCSFLPPWGPGGDCSPRLELVVHAQRHVVGVEVARRGEPVSRRGRGHRGIRLTELQGYNRRGGAADRKGGVGVALLRTGAATLAIAEEVVFALPDQPRANRPCSTHKGSLVSGYQRTVDVACIGEEPAAVDGGDAVADVGVKLLD